MRKIVFYSFLLLLVLLVAGCGQSSSGGGGGETVTVTGQLSTGTISTSIASVRAQAVASNYVVVAQDVSSKKLYSVVTDGSGNFQISGVPKDASLVLSLVDNTTGKYVGPVVFNNDYTGLTCTGTTSLGVIVFDSSKGMATPSTSLEAGKLNSSYKPRLSSGVPVGARKHGKGPGTTTGTPTGPSLDADLDGIPNLFDADNNGNGVLDEFDSGSNLEKEGLGSSSKATSVIVFPNLKIDLQDTESFISQTYKLFLAFEIDFANPDNVSSIVLTTIPTYAANCVFDQSTAYDFEASWPGEGATWLQSGQYHIYKAYQKGTTNTVKWASFIRVQNATDINAGDCFRFLITYTDSSTEEIYAYVNYVWRGIPKLTCYQFSGGTAVNITPGTYGSVAGGSSGNPYTITTGTTEATYTFTKPSDEAGSYIDANNYNWSCFYYSSATFAPGSLINNNVDEHLTTVTDIGGNQLQTTVALPITYSSTTVHGYRLEVEANSLTGDNSSFTIYLGR
ncbi:MAG: hypothetical protein NT099_06440 [Candidatus Saganbacteria bacterium]|nr:hypothetical protein [Candidatus Saganbacteria bacterium]